MIRAFQAALLGVVILFALGCGDSTKATLPTESGPKTDPGKAPTPPPLPPRPPANKQQQ